MINVAKCNLGEVKLQTMLASGLLLESGTLEALQGLSIFTSPGSEINFFRKAPAGDRNFFF